MIAGRRDVHIVGTGSYTPSRVLTNRDLEAMVDTSDEWIVSRTGIRERRIVDKDKPASFMAHQAALRALEDAGISASELDLIVVGTVTGDRPFPSTACALQHQLGARGAYAFDVSAACAGFLYGLSIAENQIAGGSVGTALVIGVETLSKITDWTDRNTCVLFGDAAGAVVLRSTGREGGILATRLHSDGSLTHLLEMPGGGSLRPASHETVDQRLHCIRMSGNDVFKHAVRAMGAVAAEALEAAGHGPEDLALLVPHQANIRIIEATAQRLHLPMSKVFVNIERYGNTSGATVPIALDEAVREGRAAAGDLVLLDAFGAGFTWGSALIRW